MPSGGRDERVIRPLRRPDPRLHRCGKARSERIILIREIAATLVWAFESARFSSPPIAIDPETRRALDPAPGICAIAFAIQSAECRMGL
jgi:hypothetical protein